MIYNPFFTSGYVSPEYFCDRENETRQLIQNIQGHSHTVLISPRRMGKTGLIEHCFNQDAVKNEFHTFFIDIYSTMNLNDFVFLLGNRICKSLKAKDKQLMEMFVKVVKSIQFTIGFDEAGMINGSFGLGDIKDSQKSLEEIFQYLEEAKRPCVVAIDEFQQIEKYPEKNVEALLRTYIQQTRNLTFIYCGSKKHLMADIFTNEKKPFYSSTAFVSLGKISAESYTAFIRRLFNEYDREIDDESIAFILDWTRRHTYFTQQLCHTIFANGEHQIGIKQVKDACEQLMQQGEAIYLQYRQMLTVKQWSYLIAVAKEGTVSQITAANFLGHHKIGSASTSQRLADALCEKGLLNDDINTKGTTYSVNDVFFSHWLERL